jgi:hypothetical protein
VPGALAGAVVASALSVLAPAAPASPAGAATPATGAGTPVTYALDRSDWVMRFTYRTTPVDAHLACRGAPTQIFVPRRDYPHGYRVHVTGARVVSAPTSAWVELVTRPGAARVTVTVSRASGSTTRVPSTAVDPAAPVPDCPVAGGGTRTP